MKGNQIINEWKERWNDGDVKFVPELFELAEKQQKEIEQMQSKKPTIEDINKAIGW